ncbi:serine hydrolase domain-containing protein [Phenylobacterium sp.]|uniref:serine hydrolase domain-containing protein n=1 Tax=Phenylobacterium sp. TaxID=1871053 RepID=UPI0035B105C3
MAARRQDGLTRRALVAALPVVGALAGPARALAADARAERVRGAALDFARQMQATGRTPGVSAAVVLPDGGLVTATAGWADPQRRLPMTPSTRLMSGSTGKSFCAATAMALVQAGKLGLDAKLAPLFRDEPWFERLPNAPALTLRMLLEHRAGFPQFLDEFGFQAAFLRDSLLGRDTGYSPRKMLSFILDKPPLTPPNGAHHYSDLHYHVVGLAIEKVTGEGYYAALRRLVLSRLGGHDVLPANAKAIPNLAAGYAQGDLIAALDGETGRSLDDHGVLRKNPSLEYTGGGLALTPRALAMFYWKLAHGLIVAPATFDEMVNSSVKLPAPPGVDSRYGLGLFVTRREGFGRYISHSGYYPGYTSNGACYLDHGVAAAVQFNTDHGPDVYEALRSLSGAVLKAL